MHSKGIERLGELETAADSTVYAWCLLSNHSHLVLRTGKQHLPWLMRRLSRAHGRNTGAYHEVRFTHRTAAG